MPKRTATRPTRTIGERMIRARQRANLTITEVARRAGVSYGTVWNWEADRCVPAKTSAEFANVAKVLTLPKVTFTQLR